MQNESNENALIPEQPASRTVDQQGEEESQMASKPLPPSPPRPPSSPNRPQSPPPRPQSPPPRASVSDLPSSPRPPPPKPPLPSSPKITPENAPSSPSLPPAGRPSLMFGPPPSRPSTSSSSQIPPVPTVDIRSLWMGSANLAEEEGEGDEGDQEPEEDDAEEEDGEDDGPVDRQGRPIRSAADVKKKRGGGPPVTEQPTIAPFSFGSLETLSFATGTTEKPKVSPAKFQQDHEEEAKSSSSFMDALQGSFSGTGFSFGASTTDTFSLAGGTSSTSSTSEASGNSSNQPGMKDPAASNTTSVVSTATSAALVPQKVQAPPPPPFSGGISDSKYQDDDEDEKSEPMDRNGRPTRATTDIKKKRTPGGGEAPVMQSDPTSTLPFIFAPVHLPSSGAGFSTGSMNDNSSNNGSSLGSSKKVSKKGKSPLVTHKGISSAPPFTATDSSESTSFSDLAASFGSFSFTAPTTFSDAPSPFVFGAKVDGPVFGEQKINFLDSNTSFSTAATTTATTTVATTTSISTIPPTATTAPNSSDATSGTSNVSASLDANEQKPDLTPDHKLVNTDVQEISTPNIDPEISNNGTPPEAAISPRRRPPPPVPRPASPPPSTSPKLLVANLPPPRKPPVLALTQPVADIRDLWMGSKPDIEENASELATSEAMEPATTSENIAAPIAAEAREMQGEQALTKVDSVTNDKVDAADS